MVKKSLRTDSKKSLFSTLLILSNLIRQFSSFSQILLSAILTIPLSKNSSHYKAELTFFQSSYLQDFEKIDTIVQCLKDKTPCQDLHIEQLAHRAKLGILQKVISFKVYNELLRDMCNKIEQGKILKKIFIN